MIEEFLIMSGPNRGEVYSLTERNKFESYNFGYWNNKHYYEFLIGWHVGCGSIDDNLAYETEKAQLMPVDKSVLKAINTPKFTPNQAVA